MVPRQLRMVPRQFCMVPRQLRMVPRQLLYDLWCLESYFMIDGV